MGELDDSFSIREWTPTFRAKPESRGRMPEEQIGDEGRYRKWRHYTPSGDLKYISPYEWEGAELQFLQQNATDKILSVVVDLSVVQSFQNPMIISSPGRAVVIYGINNASAGAYDPVANTGLEPAATSAFIFARIDSARADEGIPLKHNRGFRGPFYQLFLSWPAQATTKARIVVYKCGWVPWQNGEAAT